MGIEEPEYKVLEKLKDYEIREYGPTLVAETKVEASFDQAGNRAFRILADFIFGKNSAQAEISMTAPVSQQSPGEVSESKSDSSKSEKIAMTAPVSQIKDNSSSREEYLIQFTMPKKYTLETLPRPLDERVLIRQVPAKKVAVYSYSGSWSEKKYKRKLSEFRSALEQDQREIVGEPIFARFNSPFSLWFLRRNEIWIEIR